MCCSKKVMVLLAMLAVTVLAIIHACAAQKPSLIPLRDFLEIPKKLTIDYHLMAIIYLFLLPHKIV